MSNYGKIYNPNTKRWNKVYSTGGRTLLQKYIENLQNNHGGAHTILTKSDIEHKATLSTLADNITYSTIPPALQEYIQTSIYAKVYPASVLAADGGVLNWTVEPYALTFGTLKVKDIREILNLVAPGENSIKYEYTLAKLKRALLSEDASSNTYIFKDLTVNSNANASTLQGCDHEYSLVDNIVDFNNSKTSLDSISDARDTLNGDAKLAIELLQQNIKSLGATYGDEAIGRAYMASNKELEYKLQSMASAGAEQQENYAKLKAATLKIKHKMEQLQRFKQENIEATINSHTSIINTIANGQVQISDQQDANKRRARHVSRELESATATLQMTQRHLEEEEATLRFEIEREAREARTEALTNKDLSIQELRDLCELLKKEIRTCKKELKQMIDAETNETVKENHSTMHIHTDELEDISLGAVLSNTTIKTVNKVEASEQSRKFVFDLYSGETMVETTTLNTNVSTASQIPPPSTLSRDLQDFKTDSTLFNIFLQLGPDLRAMASNMEYTTEFPTTVEMYNIHNPVIQAAWYTRSWNMFYNGLAAVGHFVLGNPIKSKRNELAALEKRLQLITTQIEAYDHSRPAYLRLKNVSTELKDYVVVFVNADDEVKTPDIPVKCVSLTRLLETYLEFSPDIQEQKLDNLLSYKRESIEEYIQYINDTQVNGVHLKYKDILQSFNDTVSAISTLAEQ